LIFEKALPTLQTLIAGIFAINFLASPCTLQRKGFKKSEVQVLSLGEDLGEANCKTIIKLQQYK
jgi:hypothetical protein